MADPFNVDKYLEDQAVELSALSYVNQGAKRNLEVSPDLETAIREGVTAVYGPDYQVKVMSGAQGKGSRGIVGSRRHTTGVAADVWIYSPDGKKLTGDQLVPLSQHWLATKTGGVGFPAKAGQSLHLDLVGGKGPGAVAREKGEGALWYYGTPTKSQRAALGSALQKGTTPKYAVSPEAVRKGLIPPGSIPDVASLTDTASRPTPATMSAATAAKRAAIPAAYGSPKSNAEVMALYAGILPAKPASPAPAPVGQPVAAAQPAKPLSTGQQRAAQRAEQRAQRASAAKPVPGPVKAVAPSVASGVGGANIAGQVALPKDVVPKAAQAGMDQAKAATGKPPVPGLIQLVDPAAKKSGLASVPAGIPLNSGSRDSVANAAAGRAAAAAAAAKAAQKQAEAVAAQQRAAAAHQQRMRQEAKARADAARGAALRVASARAAVLATARMTPAGQAAATPGVTHNYPTVTHPGESYTFTGEDMAYQPRSVQTSDRWRTGY